MQKYLLTIESADAIVNLATRIYARFGGEDMQTNMDLLRGKMAERNVGKEELARRIGVDASTFYRKMKDNGNSFTVGQMHKIVAALNLTHEEATSIFLW